MNHKYITDHAVIRYLERVHGIDIEYIKDSMTKHGVKEACDAMLTNYTVDGIKFKIKNGKVTTIFPIMSEWASLRKLKDING